MSSGPCCGMVSLPHSKFKWLIRIAVWSGMSGDEGFSWTLRELSTMKHYSLPLAEAIFNDGCHRIQKTNYGALYFSSDLGN